MFSHSKIAVPPKDKSLGNAWMWAPYECESHEHLLHKNLNNDRLNNVCILCQDGKEVRCNSYMLRIVRGLFNDMLGSDDFDNKADKLDAPSFSSIVM